MWDYTVYLPRYTGDPMPRIKPVRLDLPTSQAWKAEFIWESFSHIADSLVLK